MVLQTIKINMIFLYVIGFNQLMAFIVHNEIPDNADNKRSLPSNYNCGYDIDAFVSQEGNISSPNYPEFYSSGLHCKWTIKGGKGNKLKLNFVDFEITQTVDCQQDYLAIHFYVKDKPETMRLCGSELPSAIIRESDLVEIEFQSSDDGETCKGFSVHFKFEEVIATCNEDVSAQIFEFVSPDYPEPIINDTNHCQLTVSHDCETPICQLRLDFTDFNLQPPEMGDCIRDQFVVQANDPIPVLCGSNENQHLYVEVKGRSSTELHVLTNAILPKPFGHVDIASGDYAILDWLPEIENNRRFKIQIQQIPCSCSYDATENSVPRAPSGCLQYHEGVHGTLKSFNFEGTKLDLEPCWLNNEAECGAMVWSGHLNNLDYTICVKKAEGYCGIQYKPTGPESFLLNGVSRRQNYSSTGNEGRNLFGSVACQSDYIVVPRARTPGDTDQVDPPLAHDRFCGRALGNYVEGSIVSYSPPFYTNVKTDSSEHTRGVDIENRGFEMVYNQLPCSAMHPFLG